MKLLNRFKFHRSPFTGSAFGMRQAWRLGAAAVAALAGLLSMIGGDVWADDAVDPHAHHHHHMVEQAMRSVADYAVPDVDLTRDDGKVVRLRSELDDGRPIVLAFIYTSCTTVCPLTSHVLSDVQTKLGSARDRVHIMSVSIDPEYDTPARLREYAQRYGAGPEWQHYTGTLAASQTAQRAFAVYRGDKMNHAPVTLVRASPSSSWVRIDGFASADEVLAELPGLQTATR